MVSVVAGDSLYTVRMQKLGLLLGFHGGYAMREKRETSAMNVSVRETAISGLCEKHPRFSKTVVLPQFFMAPTI